VTGRNITRWITPLAAAALVVGVGTSAAAAPGAARTSGPSGQPGQRACVLGPDKAIKHVIYIQFDNTHYTRDNPRVPSDLQQMPNLLNFIKGNGTLVTHEHTPLISHTADDIVTSESGLYGSDHGVPIANEYHYYVPGGSTDQAGSFAYWTDPIVDYSTGKPIADHTPTMVNSHGKNAPAPWVSYTRAGCNVGSVAAANTELENTLPDVPHVFGANSPEAKEAAKNNASGSDQAQATADFMGLSVHCTQGSAVCGHGSVPDVLRDEPGGYHGFRALFGSKFIQPVISPSGPVRDLNGHVIKDSFGQVGFPGYGGIIGDTGLAYTLDMQTHGVPVTFTYLSDLHDSEATGSPFGPGQAGYEQQLRAENKAFGEFFSRLAAHGITSANTLFVITADEGDHFVGSKPTPADCNGVKITCHYKRIGEVNVDLNGLVAQRGGVTTPFDVQPDSAPSVYVHHHPARTAARVRRLERAVAALRGHDLATGARNVKMTNFLADPVELKILHMITGDPKRNPTFTVFGNPEFWQNGGGVSCGKSCFSEPAGTDAWNHGTIAAQINTTWLGVVGPGVAHVGVDNSLWSDHTSIQPTMMVLLRLHDDYLPDGRVLGELIEPSALPAAMRSHTALLRRLGALYTQLEAPVGPFGLLTLRASTTALASKSAHDTVYAKTEAALAKLGAARDAIASKMRAVLLGAAFHGVPINAALAAALIHSGARLLSKAAKLAR